MFTLRHEENGAMVTSIVLILLQKMGDGPIHSHSSSLRDGDMGASILVFCCLEIMIDKLGRWPLTQYFEKKAELSMQE